MYMLTNSNSAHGLLEMLTRVALLTPSKLEPYNDVFGGDAVLCKGAPRSHPTF
jgi:hypothetical protein